MNVFLRNWGFEIAGVTLGAAALILNMHGGKPAAYAVAQVADQEKNHSTGQHPKADPYARLSAIWWREA